MARGARTKTRADLIIHPVRLRVLQELAKAPRTAAELQQRLPDVPQASLYRHLGRLVQGEVLQVLDEHRERGPRERRYLLPEGAGFLGALEMAEATIEDYRRYFRAYLSAQLASFERYLATPAPVPPEDGLGFRLVPVYVSREELVSLYRELTRLLSQARSLERSGERREVLFAIASIPGPGAAEQATAGPPPGEGSDPRTAGEP